MGASRGVYGWAGGHVIGGKYLNGSKMRPTLTLLGVQF